jgi:hypothetical protein
MSCSNLSLEYVLRRMGRGGLSMSEMMTEPEMGLKFEQVWAAFMELRKEGAETDRQLKESRADFDRQLKESRADFDQQLKESRADFDRQLKESRAEFDRQLKESKANFDHQLKESGAEFDRRMRKSEKDFNKRFGYLDNRFGELAEHLVVPNIVNKFNMLGYHFNDVSKVRKFYRDDGTIAAEFDILLENEKSIVGVEVKTKPVDRDIEEHIKRLEFLRGRRNELGDKREIRGAIAGAIMPEHIRRAALSAGLYVIEQSGDTVRIEAPNEVRGW